MRAISRTVLFTEFLNLVSTSGAVVILINSQKSPIVYERFLVRALFGY